MAFRTTPNMDDRSNAVAASGAFVEAAREPPEFPGWVQSGSAASFGLWLPKTYLLPVQHNSEEHREALWAASAEEEAEEAREQDVYRRQTGLSRVAAVFGSPVGTLLWLARSEGSRAATA